MGNICNGNFEKDDNTETVDTVNKNFTVCYFLLKNKTKVEMILGSYRYNKSHTLLAISTSDQLDYCSQLRDYSVNYSSTLQIINSSRKVLSSVNINKLCPYKKVLLCCLPAYKSDESEEYQQRFLNVMKQVLQNHNDITIQINHTTENSNGLPNQMLLALMIKYIQSQSKQYHFSLLSNQAKLLQLIRFELMKTQDYQIKNFIEKQ